MFVGCVGVGMGMFSGSDGSSSDGGEYSLDMDGSDIFDVASSMSRVVFRCEGGEEDDREVMVLENGLIAIRFGNKGGLYDVDEESVEFASRNGLYRFSMGSYGLLLEEGDFKKVLEAYNRIRGE